MFEHLQSSDENSICCELAHIYHYYLHGPCGNRGDSATNVEDNVSVANCSQMTATSRRPPPTEQAVPLPELLVQKFDYGDLAWRYEWALGTHLQPLGGESDPSPIGLTRRGGHGEAAGAT